MTFAETLKKLRRELNMTQEALARELNVSFATVNKWENNKAKPSRMAMMLIKEYSKRNDISEEIKTALEAIKI